MDVLATVKIDKVQLKKLAMNLRTLLNERKLSENDIAQAINIPVMTVRRIVSGETADPRISTLTMIADYLNVSIDSLLEDHQSKSVLLMNKNLPRFVPILDWQTAEKIRTVKDLDLKSWKEWHPITLGDQYTLSNEAFALESRPSMQPRFPLGTLFIIEPNEKPADTDIVLVKINKENTLSLRELIIDPPKWQLQPVVNGSEMIFYDKKDHTIMGVTILTMLCSRNKTA